MIDKIVSFFKKPADETQVVTIPTIISCIRLILTPCIVIAILNHRWFYAALLFVCASVSDFVDGFLARRFSQETVVGAYLDPIADKFLLVGSIAALAFADSSFFPIPIWVVWFVVLRELVMAVGAFTIIVLTGSIVIQPTIWGKTTTVLYIFFITFMFADYFFSWNLQGVLGLLLPVLCCFAFFSLLHYVKIGINQIRRK